MDYFSKLANNIKAGWKNLIQGLKSYFKKLLFPLYLFPIKFFTYTIFYVVRFIIKLTLAFLGLLLDCVRFPFRSLKNFLKSIFIVGIALYLVASLFVIGDYLTKQYGWWGKILCSGGVRNKLQNSVVRIIGGYSEGSGFFVGENMVVTNHHVIADEPSPKIVFSNGEFITPVKILSNKEADIAILYTEKNYPNLVLPLMEWVHILPGMKFLNTDEPVIASGYPMGTQLKGEASLIRGNYIDIRWSKNNPVGYIQTNISLVKGMSGGPLTDQCGVVIGVNTGGLAGLSLFVVASDVRTMIKDSNFSDKEITKINVDPSLSPEEFVKAFYTYLKARRMEDGFKLLSQEYLQKTNFEEWTNRFKDILDVDVIKSEKYENTNDTAFVKFSTKNWVDGEAELHYYEGTWKTIVEDGVYKMLKSKILEVDNPEFSWFYE